MGKGVFWGARECFESPDSWGYAWSLPPSAGMWRRLLRSPAPSRMAAFHTTNLYSRSSPWGSSTVATHTLLSAGARRLRHLRTYQHAK
jgi:hypothetical protein